MRQENRRWARRGWMTAMAAGVTIAGLAMIFAERPRATAVLETAARGLETVQDEDLPPGVTVSDGVDIEMFAREVQSTVVAPGRHRLCPQGRLLISDDTAKEPAAITLVDLETLLPLSVSPTFEPAPGMADDLRMIASDDHDLISLPNGEVLLVKMGRSRMWLDPTPPWFHQTYKIERDDNGMVTGFWGPGARSELLVWRSSDCGARFDFVSSIDTAAVDDAFGTPDDASGALPQKNGSLGALFQMGGTDGPLARVDPITGRIFITMGLVGNKPAGYSPFSLSDDKLNRTLVMMSSDNGSHWERVGIKWFNGWRLDVVPRNAGALAFAHAGGNLLVETGWAFATPMYPIGYIPMPPPAPQPPDITAPELTGYWGWDERPCEHTLLDANGCAPAATDLIAMRLQDRTILTRSPSSSRLILSFMDTILPAGDGFRMFSFSGEAVWTALPPIVPRTADADNFVFHVTPVDVGKGPLFYYWYDVNSPAKTLSIRGRILPTDTVATVDFGVSRVNGAPDAFDLSMLRSYGDYHTAGGYYAPPAADEPSLGTYHYYPIWINPETSKIRIAHVRYAVPLRFPTFGQDLPGYQVTRTSDMTTARTLIDPSQLDMEREEDDLPRRTPQ